MRPKSLDYTEMCVLQIYRDLFGKKYNPEVDEEKLNKQHISLQRMVYLFLKQDICIDDFGFSWVDKGNSTSPNFEDSGPFSYGFEYALKELDKKVKAINNFYEIDGDYARENLFIYDNKKNRYEAILEIIKTSCPKGYSLHNWLDVVACLEFVPNTRAVGDFKEAKEEFVLRKSNIDDTILKKAWQIKEELTNYNLVNYHKNDENKNV